MSDSRLAALAEISAVIPAGIRLLAGLLRSIAPIVNWVIFASAPVGVQDVSAIELVHITVNTRISGSEMPARSHGTPKKACVTLAPSTQNIGTPTKDTPSGNSMDRSGSAAVPAAARLVGPLPRSDLKAVVKISGRPARLTSEPTTIIVTPHHKPHWLMISAREIGTTTPFARVRCTMSPLRIMIGASIA